MTRQFLSSWRVDISTLGPVHVGSGEQFEPIGYVLDEESNSFFEFPPITLSEAFSDNDMDRLHSLVAGTYNNHTIPTIRKLIYDRRLDLSPYATRAVLASPDIQALYEQNIGTVAQHETGAINRLEIEKTFADSFSGKPVLPGSSLKGAIRTALLNHANQGRSLPKEDRNRVNRDSSLALQKRLFDYRNFDGDPMRLVHIADGMWIGESGDEGFTAETAVAFAVNRRKQPIVKEGKELPSRAQEQGLNQIVEVIPGMRWRKFRSRLTLHLTDLEHDNLPKRKLRWSAQEIASACNDFYRRGFDDEAKKLLDRGLISQTWYKTCLGLIEGATSHRLDSNPAFLLRVGRHSSAESMTLDGVRSIRIIRGNAKPEYRDEASTWWLASNDRNAETNLTPFGWVLVELAEGDSEPVDRPEVLAQLNSFQVAANHWRGQVHERLVELQARRDAKIEKDAEKKRQQQKEKAEVEKEKARRNEMTQEERDLDDLRRLLEKARNRENQTATAQLRERTTLLLRSAHDWPDSSKTQAADLAEAVYKLIGYPKGKKGKERKEQIAHLRGDQP